MDFSQRYIRDEKILVKLVRTRIKVPLSTTVLAICGTALSVLPVYNYMQLCLISYIGTTFILLVNSDMVLRANLIDFIASCRRIGWLTSCWWYCRCAEPLLQLSCCFRAFMVKTKQFLTCCAVFEKTRSLWFLKYVLRK